MKLLHLSLYFTTVLWIGALPVAAGDRNSTNKIHTDLPYINSSGVLEELIYFQSEHKAKGNIDITCMRYTGASDSALVYHNRFRTSFKTGINKIRARFNPADSGVTCTPQFIEILKRTGGVAPGNYRVYITLQGGDAQQHQSVFLLTVDSLLPSGSGLRANVNNSLMPSGGRFMSFKGLINKVTASKSGNALSQARKKIALSAKTRGLKHNQYERNGKTVIDFYYDDWFAGRYEVAKDKKLGGQLTEQDENAAATNPNKLATNDLDAHPSLYSQYKSFKKQKDDNEDLKGEITLSTTAGTGQEQYSGIDNNYMELKGGIEVPIMHMPVIIEGLYTTQDANRQVKSSYFRVHYDAEKMKDQLRQFVGSYSQKFAETRSKGVGMEQIYKSGIAGMESQKAKLIQELEAGKIADAKNIGIGDIDTSGITGELKGKADSGGKVDKKAADIKAKKEKLIADRKKAEDQYKKIQELDRKIEKYKLLLDQNRNTNYFDSAVGYSKVNSKEFQEATSYKQMAKRSADLLPDGTAKKFITGLTTMDAGMFPKDASKYTMSGQMLKGADIGYDLGFFEIGATAGKTEYIGRDGNIDKYTCYSARTTHAVGKTQKVSVIYYGYTSDRKIYTGDGFFKNAGLTAPSFFQPTHILSVNYDAVLGENISIQAEGATNIGRPVSVSEQNRETKEQMAWHIAMEGSIPKTNVRLHGVHDRTGKQFENNTIPVNFAGTEQYKVGGQNDFFHSFLTVGVEYNYLIQSSLSSNGNNTKWGFDIKTHSRRYPNVSLSYKPFSTFRSFTDTLNIPQRPMVGSVWTGKASYQIRQHNNSWRFSAIYNRSNTSMDTVQYGSTLLQGMCMYATKKITTAASAGYMAQSSIVNTGVPNTIPNNMTFVNISADLAINKSVSISWGQEVGRAPFGLCRYSLNTGMVCNIPKKQVMVRLSMRGSAYQLTANEEWKQLLSGNMDLTYRFKSKMKKHNF